MAAAEILEQIDRDRLDAAFDRIGHRSSPVFRARLADAYDATEAELAQLARAQARSRTKKRRDRRARVAVGVNS